MAGTAGVAAGERPKTKDTTDGEMPDPLSWTRRTSSHTREAVIKIDGSGNTQKAFSAGLHPFLPDLGLKKRVAYRSWWPTNNALNNASFLDGDDDLSVYGEPSCGRSTGMEGLDRTYVPRSPEAVVRGRSNCVVLSCSQAGAERGSAWQVLAQGGVDELT
jgi:hypothetical protein